MANLNVLTARMRYWCQTVSLGYDQYQRWDIRPGGEADCSSLVIWALREAGFDTGSATYTGNMSANLTARGWQRLPVNGHPQAGDILLNDVHHVAVYLGGGLLAQASISEHGTIRGTGGDQTGRETNVKAYYNYPWNAYLRYTGTQSTTPAPAADFNPATDKLDVDADFARKSVLKWQHAMGTTEDGIVSGQLVPDGISYSRPNLNSSVIQHGGGGSDVVRATQQLLAARGLYHGKIDGLLGPDTLIGLHQLENIATLAMKPWTSFGPGLARSLQNDLNDNKLGA